MNKPTFFKCWGIVGDLWVLGALQKLCQPKMGVSRPTPAPLSANVSISLSPIPPL